MPLPHNLRSPVDMMRPRVWGVCDRCYFQYYLDELVWQFEWVGNALANLRIRVCPRCLDRPFEQLRPVIIGPDPVPPRDPRPPQYRAQMGGGQPPLTDPQLIIDE